MWGDALYETVVTGFPASLGGYVGPPISCAHSAVPLLSQGFHAVGENGVLGGGVSEDKDVGAWRGVQQSQLAESDSTAITNGSSGVMGRTREERTEGNRTLEPWREARGTRL